MDNSFLRKLTEIIEEHINDPDFSVEKLAREMNMSYSSLWRRVSKYTGKSANQFIKEVRLTRAMEILRDEDVTITEIAYRVGFSSPNYFSTCFQDFFGYSPGELKKLGGSHSFENETKKENANDKPENHSLSKSLDNIKISRKRFTLVLIVAVFAITLILVANWIRNQEKSISVLYPIVLTPDTLTMDFCGGFQDQLFSELSKIEELTVRGRTSTERFRNKSLSLSKIGRKLNANYLVESSVNTEGNDITIRVRLYKSKKDKPIWTDSWIRKFEDIFILQDEIVTAAARGIKNELLPVEVIPEIKINTNNQIAENFFLEGKHNLYPFNLKPGKAYDSYLNAIRNDSSFAEAYLGLAATLNYMYSDIETRNDTLLTACHRALDKVAELNSSLPGISTERGIALLLSGKFSDAVDLLEAEHEIYYESTVTLINIARAYMSLGMWNKAKNYMNEFYKMEPYSTRPNYLLGQYFELLRDCAPAIWHYDRAYSKIPTYGPPVIGRIEAHLKAGNKPKSARFMLDSIVQDNLNSYPDSLRLNYEYAIIDIYQGRYQEAINNLSGWDRVTAKSPPYYFRPSYLLKAQVYGYMNESQLESQYYDSTRIFIEALLEKSEGIRNEARVKSALGIAYAGLGRRDKALELAAETTEMLAANPDAWLGPYAMEDVAYIYAKTGKYIDAFQLIRKLLTDPGPLTVSLIEIDPRWAELREQPEYRGLIENFGE